MSMANRTGYRRYQMRRIHRTRGGEPTLCSCRYYPPIVQQYHLPLYHALCAEVEKRFFAE